MAAKGAGKFRGEPMHRTKPRGLRTGLVDLAVSSRRQRFQIAPQLRLGGESGDAGEVGGDLLIEQMKAFRLLERWLAIRREFESIEHLLQLRPGRTLGGDEAGEVENHGRKTRSSKLEARNKFQGMETPNTDAPAPGVGLCFSNFSNVFPPVCFELRISSFELFKGAASLSLRHVAPRPAPKDAPDRGAKSGRRGAPESC